MRYVKQAEIENFSALKKFKKLENAQVFWHFFV